jgi:6-pyruvoyltetrahydropterin/6-carboxytetrahydropterin synthase
MRITKQLRTETGHRLTDYDGRCAHLHGHSYLWEVTVSANDLTPNGMVTDFKDLKKAMNEVLDPLDHCMVLAESDPLHQLYGEKRLAEMLKATNEAPPRLIIWHENPTAESFAAWAAAEIQKELDAMSNGCTVAHVRVWETATSHAEWGNA